MSKHLITQTKYVECPYCEKGIKNQFKLLHWKHLLTHKKTLEDVRKEFPNHPTITLEEFNKRKENTILARNKKKLSEDKTKKINCYYCKKQFEANLNISNQYGVCPECKSKGLKNIGSLKGIEQSTKNIKEKYGVDNVSKIKDVIEKRNKTIQEKRKDPEYYKKIVKKREKTLVKNYGEEYKNVISEKIQETILKKYGYKFALQIPESNIKFKKTILEKFGGSPTKGKFLSEETKKKLSIARKGIPKSEEHKLKISKTHSLNFIEKLEKYLDYYELELLDQYFQGAHVKHNWKCKKCGTEFTQIWNFIQQGYKCPNCYPRNIKNSSIAEKEILDFLYKINPGWKVLTNNRFLLNPYELDFVIPEKKIAIEFCGLYFHSEALLVETRKNFNIDIRKYHLWKLEECLKKGYNLITIFEDEWVLKKDIVKARIQQITNNSSSKRIHARDCIIKEIESKDKIKFLEEFHIQGSDRSKINLGAFYDEQLVSVMTFSLGNIAKGSRTKEGEWELSRFCNNYNYHIPGIASKLLSYFKKNFQWKTIFTYADRRWSIGNLYEKIGFTKIGNTPVNYWYIDPNKFGRISRFNLRKKLDEPKNKTEMELRIEQGYLVIWDCGNIKYELYNNLL